MPDCRLPFPPQSWGRDTAPCGAARLEGEETMKDWMKHWRLLIHPATAALLETMLLKLRDEGEDAAFAYIRQEILGKSQDAPPPDPRRF